MNDNVEADLQYQNELMALGQDAKLGRLVNRLGDQYGRLFVIAQAETMTFTNGSSKARWVALCDCGKQVTVIGDNLRKGTTTSCGCYKAEVNHNRVGQAGAGNNVTYKGAHHRLLRARGKASAHDCVDCGSQAREWSYVRNALSEQIDSALGYAYSADPSDYAPRCRPCHVAFDAPEKISA